MMPATLSGDDCARIHAGSLETLETLGVRVDDPVALMPPMGRTIAALDAAGLRQGVRVVIGGAPVTPQFGKEIGADLYAATASEAAQLLRDGARGGRA